jgi:hypothetical protein
MPDELMNQISSNTADEELDLRILRTLEAAPELHVPADFVTRVSRQLPARRPVSLTPTHYGRNAVFIGMVITLIALLALTLHNGTTAAFGLTQSLLLAQFIVLTVWLSIRRQTFS